MHDTRLQKIITVASSRTEMIAKDTNQKIHESAVPDAQFAEKPHIDK